MAYWLSDLDTALANEALHAHIDPISELLGLEAGDSVCFDVSDAQAAYEKCVRILTTEDRNLLYRFHLAGFPGCCGILISHSAYTFAQKRQGLHSYMSPVKQELAAYLGYSVLLATDIADNRGTATVMQRDGWETIRTFNNLRRTRNDVNIYAVDVTDYDSAAGDDDWDGYYEEEEEYEEDKDTRTRKKESRDSIYRYTNERASLLSPLPPPYFEVYR